MRQVPNDPGTVDGSADRRESRGRRRDGTLPARFQPQFWQDADRRCAIVREIESRVDRLKQDTGADSVQKDMLCQRAVFLVLLLETAERNALEGRGTFDAGSYTQSVNSLMGLLKSLGLERKVQAKGLKAYIGEKTA